MIRMMLSFAAAVFLSGCVAAPQQHAQTEHMISPAGATAGAAHGGGRMPGMHGMMGNLGAGHGMMMCGQPGAAGGCGMMGHGASAGSAGTGGCPCCAAMMKPRS